jgi:hypothetical protein
MHNLINKPMILIHQHHLLTYRHIGLLHIQQVTELPEDMLDLEIGAFRVDYIQHFIDDEVEVLFCEGDVLDYAHDVFGVALAEFLNELLDYVVDFG